MLKSLSLSLLNFAELELVICRMGVSSPHCTLAVPSPVPAFRGLCLTGVYTSISFA